MPQIKTTHAKYEIYREDTTNVLVLEIKSQVMQSGGNENHRKSICHIHLASAGSLKKWVIDTDSTDWFAHEVQSIFWMTNQIAVTIYGKRKTEGLAIVPECTMDQFWEIHQMILNVAESRPIYTERGEA